MKRFDFFQIWTSGVERGGLLLICTEIYVPQNSKSPECVLNFKDLSNHTGFTETTSVSKKNFFKLYLWYSEHLDCTETIFSKTNFAKGI